MTKNEPGAASASMKKLDKSRVEFTGSIPVSEWEKYRVRAIKNINDSVSIEGFRKGKVPENILIAKVGEMAILEEIAELALSKAYVDILLEKKIEAIGKPEIRVTKLAKDNPIEFTAVTAVMPEISLPDYKKIAAEQVMKSDPAALKVSEKDIEDAVLRVRRQHSSHDDHEHDPVSGEVRVGEKKMTKEEHERAVDAAMPELTDDFVKGLGDFNDVPDFKNKLSDMIAEQKRNEAQEKTRVRIADAIADDTKVEIPDIMIESELDRTQSQFSADIERMGVKIDDYLKHAKKTIEDVRKEWRPHAEKKARLQLILNEIAKKEGIKPDQQEIDNEVKHIVEHYKDADKDHAAVYAETVLTNEKVFRFLETTR